jgi:hypothetical protein
MSIDKKRVSDVLTDDRGFIDINIVDVIYNLNTSSLAGISGFQNPNVFLTFVLL